MIDRPLHVEVRDLKRFYGKTRAVDGISFAFESGHVFGFVGPNGAGKTTTLRVLATLDEPTDGDAFLNGVSVREDPEVVRTMVGFVPDSLPTHSDITVLEYLDFFARAYGLGGRERTAAVEGVVEFTRLQGLRDKLIKSLSKGMKQRVSLGRALIHDPAVLLMDEPAAGLDPRARIEFRELVAALAEAGKAILISSHILSELTEICNGVVIIDKGKVLETGTMEEVRTRDRTRFRRALAIRPLDRHEEMRRDLLETPRVEQVGLVGAELRVEIEGSDEECCAILAGLVQLGYRIVEFRPCRDDLEDVFMRITGKETE